MTHAFFKALLFMAAGSMISAMANNQNIDRMGGFRKAMPFTSALLLIGGLALAGFPGTSGFFSKDEILAFAATAAGCTGSSPIGGYVGALMTAFYAFRIGFRVVCRRARARKRRSSRRATSHHADADQPGTPARPRTPTSASPARSTTSPSASGRCGSRWRCSASARCSAA